uniref:Alpha-conotoxin-like ts14a n=1 Tax=Conus tessulatus TaxID=101317 RepID=CAEA_CONTS|nr:RecName: Full=Alpha-conotoxin-like ts14a [Conus tessulatus]
DGCPPHPVPGMHPCMCTNTC